MYERDKDFSKPLSIRPNGHVVRECGWCKEKFMTTGNSILCDKCSIKKEDSKSLPI
jgi:hypothetical protein